MKRLAAVLLPLSLAACSESDPTLAPVVIRTPFEADQGTLVARDPTFDSAISIARHYSGLESRERLLIGNAADWERIWSRMIEGFGPRPALPPVDFSERVVLVAAMGTRNSGGFVIRIDSVRVANGTARAWVTERSPGSNCVVTGALTEPTDAVVIPRVASVEWSERAQVVPCGP